MAPISKLAKQYGFGLIEDASHAVGATYKSQPVGNCAFSDIAVQLPSGKDHDHRRRVVSQPRMIAPLPKE